MNAPEPLTPTADTPYTRRARYFSDDNGVTFRWSPVPVRQFLAERDRAFDPTTPTGMIALDTSDALGTPFPATTPALLLRYLKIRAGEELRTSLNASGEIYYVIRGNGSDNITWGEGDMFLFGGGRETAHRAVGGDCLLYLGTDEPLLAYDGLRAPEPRHAKVGTTHWPAAEIERRLEIE